MSRKNTSQKFSHLLEEKVLCPFQEFTGFFRQYLANPDVIGALSPSSSFVAKAVIEPLQRASEKKRRILEIGAGTGVITKHLLTVLRPGDHLDVIEFVPELVVTLRRLVEESDKKNQVSIHEKKVEEFNPDLKYDHVISGLPLTSFPKDSVHNFYQQLDREFLCEGGMFSYYEYLWIPQIRLGYHQLLRSIHPGKYDHFRSVLDLKKTYLKGKPVNIKKIWFNFTPMCVVHVSR